MSLSLIPGPQSVSSDLDTHTHTHTDTHTHTHTHTHTQTHTHTHTHTDTQTHRHRHRHTHTPLRNLCGSYQAGRGTFQSLISIRHHYCCNQIGRASCSERV